MSGAVTKADVLGAEQEACFVPEGRNGHNRNAALKVLMDLLRLTDDMSVCPTVEAVCTCTPASCPASQSCLPL
jgi:hypothetical protein